MLLNGTELAGYIKERHVRQVRALRGRKIYPKLAIVQTGDDPVIDTFTHVKQRYGRDIGVAVDVHKISQNHAKDFIKNLNRRKKIYGIVLQLPLEDPAGTDKLIGLISAEKDVDGLKPDSPFDPPTPVAIFWLLTHYNIDLTDKKVVVIGRGRLVGAPLIEMLESSGVEPVVLDEHTKDIASKVSQADIIFTATGQPRLITSSMVKPGAVVIDAGTSNEDGQPVGDADPALYEREDIKITPSRDGIGPLTVAVLFENLLAAAEQTN